jgi:uncharacterized protein
MYLLDGRSHFSFASAMVDFLTEAGRMPPLIVVAIDSGTFSQRTHDLTPPSSAEIDNRFLPGGGGAEGFLSFLTGELIPFVDKTYRTRPYKVLVGHSFGGLFVVYVLTTAPKLFNAYIAIDPTLSWNNGATLAQAESFLSKTKELSADLYLTAANSGGSVPGCARRLASILDDKAPAGFRWHFEWLQQDDHVSAPLRSVHDGLDAIFDGWYLTDPLKLYDQGGLEAIHRHFTAGGKRYGYDRTTPPFTVSLVVAGLVKAGRLEEASKVLLHDPHAFPPPWNQLDALARAYEGRGKTELAAKYYALSLKENPQNEWARRKLAELGVDAEASSEKKQ